MLNEQIGKLLVGVGLSVTLMGGILILASKIPWLRLGRLPGDVNIQRDGFSLFFPITTMLLLSAGFSLIMFLIQRFRK